jgi:hypothetical protein
VQAHGHGVVEVPLDVMHLGARGAGGPERCDSVVAA